MGATMTEKIFAAHTVDGHARAGEVVVLKPDVVMLNDVGASVTIAQFAEMNATRVYDPSRVVLVADHFSPAKDVQSADLIRVMREFGEQQGIDHYYHTGKGGIEHAVLADIGRVYPGALIFGGDSHTCTAGSLNAAGIGFGSTDLAAALALGELWARVPATIRVDLSGRPSPYVSGKDVILDVIRSLGSDGAVNASIEIGGDGLASLNVDERMAIANMAVEAGADTCVLEYDRAVGDYVTSRGAIGWTPILPDADAAYLRRIAIELDRLEPTVAAPPSPANGQRVSDLRGTPVDQVYIGNCANGTLTDLRQTAAMLKGRRVKANVRVFVVPATQAIYRAAMQEGLLSIISEAGATISAPTCGACFGGHNGILSAGETAIATTNRNFRGRMGDPTAKVFLANAWVAAAAALAGEIVHPADLGHADLDMSAA